MLGRYGVAGDVPSPTREGRMMLDELGLLLLREQHEQHRRQIERDRWVRVVGAARAVAPPRSGVRPALARLLVALALRLDAHAAADHPYLWT
jgi:hypothetical protein